MFRVGILRSRSTFAPFSSTMTSGSPDNRPDSSSRNFPSAASTSPEPGTFHFGGQRPGLVRRNVGLGRVTQPAQEDVVEVLFNLSLVQLLQDPLFQVFRPFPGGGMGLLAAVGIDLLVSSDLLNQVGQEERANMSRQRSGRGARNEVLETGKQARRPGLFGRRFLGHAERSPTRGREERTEGSGPCRYLTSRDATRRNAITMTPACMGRSGIHFTREHLGSKKDLRSSGLRFSWQAKGATFSWCRKAGGPSAPGLGGWCATMSQLWPFPRTRGPGAVERNSFRFFPADRFACSNGTNATEKRNEFRSTKKSPRRRSRVGAQP